MPKDNDCLDDHQHHKERNDWEAEQMALDEEDVGLVGVCLSCEVEVYKENFRDCQAYKRFAIDGFCQECQDEEDGQY